MSEEFKQENASVSTDSAPLALDVQDLTIRFEVDGQVIRSVNHVNLTIEKGHTLGLVGETGAGKTTTAKAILRLIETPPGIYESGKIFVDGKDVFSMNKRQLHHYRGYDVAMIFQDPMTSLNPVETVGDQIAETFMLHESINRYMAQQKAGDMLEMVGIPRTRAGEYPHQFSGGMKQRVVIAIALACHPGLLLADEPTTALDVTIQAQVLDLMRKLREEYKMSMLMITHDLGIVAEICDEVAVMYAGHIVERGTLEDVFNHARHPYTEGLFNSLPNINERVDELTPIPGQMPDPSRLPAGCPFAPRCPYADERCREERPAERALSGTHYVSCLAYDREGFHINRRDKD